MSHSLVTLEQDACFSQSLLWKYQKDYFTKKGVNAWAHGDVPFYVTSNMVIAYSYAQMVLRFIQDNLANGGIDPEQPIYLFELATGSGKFSYLFLYNFVKFLQQFKLEHLKFRYVMTDFTDNNLRYWQTHESLQPFVASGILDFAIFTIGEEHDIVLVNSKISLNANSCANPIIVVANYTFDTVPHDLFKVSAGKLEVGLVTTKSPSDNVIDTGVNDLDRLQTDFSFQAASLPYYHNNDLDSVLETYTKEIAESSFLVPTGAIDAVNSLRKLSRDRMFLISCDKGYTSIDSLKNLGTPHIAFHGSFSMMVNFDFLGRYMQNLGGDALLAEDYEGTKVSIFCLGAKFTNLPNTTWAHRQFNTHLATNEFLLIKNFLLRTMMSLNLEQILSLLKFSFWDPDIFFSLAPRFPAVVAQASPTMLQAVRRGLELIYERYYFVKNYKKVLFELGHVYQLIGDLDDALKRYQEAQRLFGEEAQVYFNMGMCYYYKNELQQAVECFQKAHEINPSNSSAKDWAELVSKELTNKE